MANTGPGADLPADGDVVFHDDNSPVYSVQTGPSKFLAGPVYVDWTSLRLGLKNRIMKSFIFIAHSQISILGPLCSVLENRVGNQYASP
ncbi:hypothetical protein AVEN_223866-1 [Araneus ventricosus]|uniref:Uncharacterized protein n=1 Tax=Araneus ventricosus TaxID=182803 RepID=A0A4Y2QL62_ARAVE|nr:hypothetical protein AVEN_92127-1 [Araneus ventricosus]GBN64005.1 hypothetical protein AVEN_223866-1 [Araneus ventricosus]